MALYKSTILRKVILPIFQKFNPGSITIKHHFTNQPFTLHSFKHKGYWYHGKNREKDTIDLFNKLINKEQTVIEIGGHIGYFSLLFSSLVGEKGKVLVFEPGENNLPYTRKNLSQCNNIKLIEKAASDTNGMLTFYIENLTGQNNTLVKDYDVFTANSEVSFVESSYQKVEVESVRIDDFILENKIFPNFIKIDVEGAELMVLQGMTECLKNIKPILMVELTNNNKDVIDLVKSYGYEVYNPEGQVFDLDSQNDQNTFCLHKETHKGIINQVFNNA
jgi:FkbM family methyltransferase